MQSQQQQQQQTDSNQQSAAKKSKKIKQKTEEKKSVPRRSPRVAKEQRTEQKNAFLLIYVHLASDASVNVNVNVDRDRGRDASVAANRTYSKICTCSREFAAWRFHANEPNGNIPAHSSSPSVSLSALPKKLSPETILSLCRKTKTSFELE